MNINDTVINTITDLIKNIVLDEMAERFFKKHEQGLIESDCSLQDLKDSRYGIEYLGDVVENMPIFKDTINQEIAEELLLLFSYYNMTRPRALSEMESSESIMTVDLLRQQDITMFRKFGKIYPYIDDFLEDIFK